MYIQIPGPEHSQRWRQEERCAKAERATFLLLNFDCCCVFDQMQKSNDPKVKREYFESSIMEKNLFQAWLSAPNWKTLAQNWQKLHFFFFFWGPVGANCASLKVHQDVCTEDEYSHLTQLHKHSEPISVSSRGRKTSFFLALPVSIWLIVKTCWATSAGNQTNTRIHKYWGFNTKTGECKHQDVI